MSDISILMRLVSGVARNVDISANTLVTTSIKVGGGTPTELTKTILDKLINLQNGTDFADGTNAHTHDGRYFTETELGAQTNGASGASKIGIDVTPAFTNFTSGSTVQSALEGIDTALGTASVVEFLDSTFRLKDDGDNTKKIAFQASGIATATTRTITMPNADVDLGGLTNANIAAGAAIAYSKLAALTVSRLLVSDGSGVVSVSAVTSTEAGYLSGVTSAIQTQLDAKALDSVVIKKDGSVAFTADQPMGGFKLTGLAAGSAAGHSVRYEQAILASGANAWTANQSLGGFKITNSADPSGAQDLTTKAYVDGLIDGRDWKNSVLVATTANITLSGEQTIDGVLTSASRVLVKDQTAGAENGIYVSAAGAWTRASDADTANELIGAAVFVEQGTANADKQFAQTVDVITLGTTALVWVVTSANSFSGHDMIALSGGQISVDLASTGGLESSNPGNAAGQLQIKLDGTTLSKSASGLKVGALGITNAEISATAAIAYSKLALSASIVNADIAAGAAIAYSKLALSASIVNADIAAGAAIAYSKLSLASSIVNADIAAGAAIAYSKLSLASSIVNADIAAGAAIADTKLDTISTANKVSGSAIQLSATPGLQNNTGLEVKLDGATLSKSASGLKADYVPMVKKTFVAGEAFAANTSFAVRIALTGETAGRVYKADYDASVSDKFYAVGMIEGSGAAAKTAGDSVDVVLMGTITLGSSDTAFAAGEVGQACHLLGSGAWDAVSQITYTTNQASYRIGMVQETSKILVGNAQILGVN